ncbi:MAG: proliferating cell nuclear antigen (pcna) [Candidatus Woesearchaeota archaeon]
MKVTLAEPKILKESIAIISELVTETRITFTKEKMEIIAMDPANVAMVIFRIPNNFFAEYDVSNELMISINLNNFKQILRRVKNSDVLSLESLENKLKITMKDKNTRTFYLPLIDLDDRQQKIPSLEFKSEVEIPSTALTEAIEDVDVVSESVTFATEDMKFKVSAAGDLTKADIEMPAGEEIKIKSQENHKSKYSTEYLKKMMSGSKLSSRATIKFSNDYPLYLEYKELDKVSLAFILAPRVDND